MIGCACGGHYANTLTESDVHYVMNKGDEGESVKSQKVSCLTLHRLLAEADTLYRVSNVPLDYAIEQKPND